MLMAIFAKMLAKSRDIWIHLSPAESFSCRCGRVTADSEVADSDFPHTVTFECFVREVRGFIERKDLPPGLSRRTLWDNPKRLYGI
jgi:hypothetical protein